VARRWFKRRWDESRGDKFDSWGAATWFVEVGDDGWPLRQVEVYDDGPVLRYGPNRTEDDYGGLGAARLEAVEDWTRWVISAAEFEEAWSSASSRRRAPDAADEYVSPNAPRPLGRDRRVDSLVGRTLVAVERLSWTETDGSANLRVGPIHLRFGGGRGAFVSGETDWSLGVGHTRSGNDSWLVPYQYDVDGSRWVLRDATEEQPFQGFRGARLKSCESVRNERGEQVGVIFDFDVGTLSLRLDEGEVAI
jgi:hypothetical protein